MVKNRLKTLTALFLVSVPFLLSVHSQEALLIRPADLSLIPDYTDSSTEEGRKSVKGYHLYIRKLPEVNSVLLTETTRDPELKEPNYAYRAPEYNSINGDERRLLDGKFLESETSRYSLTASTIEHNTGFPECFHIYIPNTLLYGYSWTRHGEVTIGHGTFINIRAFSKLYNDYTGQFLDNPYMFDLLSPPKESTVKKSAPVKKVQELPPLPSDEVPDLEVPFDKVKESEPAVVEIEAMEPIVEPVVKEVEKEEKEAPVVKVSLTDDYNSEAARVFSTFSEKVKYSKVPETLTADIMDYLLTLDTALPVDIVFVVDATGSMKKVMDTLKKELIIALNKWKTSYKDVRFGLILYRDYEDSYRYNGLPFKYFDWTRELKAFSANLNTVSIRGTEGGDIPEAVYEALYGAATSYKWNKRATKKIVLIGDAPPHPKPRMSGKYTKERAIGAIKEKGISLVSIVTPDDKARRGR